jgi:hypothetical protein
MYDNQDSKREDEKDFFVDRISRRAMCNGKKEKIAEFERKKMLILAFGIVKRPLKAANSAYHRRAVIYPGQSFHRASENSASANGSASQFKTTSVITKGCIKSTLSLESDRRTRGKSDKEEKVKRLRRGFLTLGGGADLLSNWRRW